MLHPDRIRFCKSLSPLFPGFCAKPVPAESAKSDFYSKLLGAFYVNSTQQHFPPQIHKINLICSKEN